jgi:regulator of sigma E protease
MSVVVQILQLLLSLSILVVFHEFGHFLAARIFKTRVEKFYLFFNPWFSIFKVNFRGTEYGLGWLPLGGYVKISGMIDESMDKEQMKKPPQPYEFRSKPAWQRLIIMIGGVTVNVILAILIYIAILTVWGEKYLPTSEVNKNGIVADSLAQEMGLRTGDRIISIDGQEVEDFSRIPAFIILEEATSVQVMRDGKMTTVDIPEGFLSKLIKQEDPTFLLPRVRFAVDGFAKVSVAKEAGIKEGDSLVRVNDFPINYFDEFRDQIIRNKGNTIQIVALREGDSVPVSLVVPDDGMIGISANLNYAKNFKLKEKSYSFGEAIPAGFTRTFKGISDYLKQLRLLFSPEVKAYESVGGFITIGSIFPKTWNWEAFWKLTAFLSIMLAILNLLPIPALDGGHVMFLMYEIITGRKPSDRFMEVAQLIGMILLLALLVFANANDVVKLINRLF